MALIDAVRKACNRLAAKGWGTLLKKHGLDIKRADLETELAKPLNIDRDVPGFEDFAFEGTCGIQPGSPARSLLYHALASPNVVEVNGKALGAFPTPAEIQAVENYVFGVRPPSLQEISALAAGDLLAIVVYSTEYRVAVDTVHRRHADLCFSRTGVARVGTAPPLYDARARGFVPFVKGNANAARVLPARYAAYIAVQREGDEPSFGPMRFNFRRKHPEMFESTSGTDENRKFWVPLHKLFSGPQCIRDRDLQVDLAAHHVNEKIRRIHLELTRRGNDTGWKRPDVDDSPFRFTDGIADFAAAGDNLGVGLLVPTPHKRMVEPAKYKGKPLTFKVPNQTNGFSPSLTIESVGRARPAPEYVHVRTAPGEPTPDLNDLPDVVDVVDAGGYEALHYVDFTGDGWVEPVCPDLNVDIPRTVSAYSMVTAPDFYYTVDQRELMDWWLERAPTGLRGFLWQTAPLTLADERVAPNLQLNRLDIDTDDPGRPRANFRPEDDTVTAIVSMPLRGQRQERPLVPAIDNRHSWLPDAAAGIFAPGWDTSFDRTGGVAHLAAYGLGSPFPEDTKLCAALSTFWPSVAPDAGRSFSDVYPTVSPMTDEELGVKDPRTAWDGVRGPRVVTVNGSELVEYARFTHVDYVRNALDQKFSMALTGFVDTHRYTARVLAIARAYLAVGVPISTPERKDRWQVVSFRPVRAADKELSDAFKDSNVAPGALGSDVFRVELFTPTDAPQQHADHRKAYMGISARTVLFVGGLPTVLIRTATGPFRRRVVPV